MPSFNHPKKAQNADGATLPDRSDSKSSTNRELILKSDTDGGLLLAEALGCKWPDDLPTLFTRPDGEKLVWFLEKNRHAMKGIMVDHHQRKTVASWTSMMLGRVREAKRTTVLMRWFRDPVAEADKKGIHAISPVIFNGLLGIVVLAIAVTFFALFVQS